MTFPRLLLLSLLSPCFLWPQAQPAEDVSAINAVIQRGRAAIGNEDALNNVDSLYLEGVLEVFADNMRGDVRIFLQKPTFQRIEVETDTFLKVTIVGEDIGWELLTDKTVEGAEATRRILTPAEYWKNRYGAVENLYFYKGYLRERGVVKLLERTFFEGEEVDVLEVTFDQKNIHQRLVSVSSGELVASRTVDGTTVVERERLKVEDILMPKEVEYYSDKKRVSRVRFHKLEVNPWLDLALFRLPVFR